MKKLLFLLVILSGCFSKRNMIQFNPTDSMCVDATVANMHNSGCSVVSIEKTMYGMTRISCYEAASGPESSWITNEFFAIAFGTSIPEDVKPICTDPFVIVTTAERD